MAIQILRCLACGAPLQSAKCDYCDTVHIGLPELEQETVNLYADNCVVATYNLETNLRLLQNGGITMKEAAANLKKLGELM